MKKILLIAMAGMMMACGNTASGNNESDKEAKDVATDSVVAKAGEPSLRECTTFSTKFRKDENDQVDAVIVTCNIDVEKQEFTCEFPWAKDEDWLGEAGEIEEEDINFDGVPDLLVCLGNFAVGYEPDYLYSAFVWNASEGKFEEVEQIAGAFNLRVDKENKAIISEYKTAVGDHVTDTYKWKDGKIVLESSESFNPDELEEE